MLLLLKLATNPPPYDRKKAWMGLLFLALVSHICFLCAGRVDFLLEV
jgi:hypothetical protein